MRKWFSVFVVCVMVSGSAFAQQPAADSNETVESLNRKIDNLKKDNEALDAQVKALNASITQLSTELAKVPQKTPAENIKNLFDQYRKVIGNPCSKNERYTFSIQNLGSSTQTIVFSCQQK